jgi:subtilase family serine protease
MRRAYTSVFLTLALLALFSGLEPYWANGRVQPIPEVYNPLVYRLASLTTPGLPPFVPSDIRKAYNFLPLYSRGINGTGTRIAIIDAFGSGSLSSDLASFDSLTGLPSTTVNTYYPDGVPKRGNSNWAVETSLDVEWAHAIAPKATIDVVVSLDASLSHIFDAISFVANSLTSENVLTMSFGASESVYPITGSNTIAATHQLFVTMATHRTTPFASSGDAGATTCCNIQYPASDPLVVAVGGTTLNLNSTAQYVGETAWSGSTAGASTVFSKPVYQQGLGDTMRDDVDVSYDADPNTGFLVVFGGSKFQVGGTSAGSPQWAAMIDLASQANATRLGTILPQLYKLPSYHDVTTGSNGFFSASKGWDYPTGLGTPDANATVNSLVGKRPDVAVTGIVASRNLAYSKVTSNPTMVTVTAANPGSSNETFTITLRANTTIIGSQTVTMVGGTNRTVSFLWKTDPFARGNYALSAHASNVTGETNLANNDLTSPTMFVIRLAGDANGDCTIDIADLTLVGGTFGTTSSSAAWNPATDFNNDHAVAIDDLVTVGSSFGTHC